MSKKKISLAIIAAFAVLITSASVISYSIANKNSKRLNQVGAEGDANAGPSNPGSGSLSNWEYISNIDLIIENSHKDDDDSYYHIVEIVPETENSTDASDLEKYIASKGFKNWVIDENAERSLTMADNKIDYKKVVCGSSTKSSDKSGYGDSTIEEVLREADLIYLYSPHTSSYNKLNNMSSEIYDLVRFYALGSKSFKPIIIDNLGSSASDDSKARTYQVFANDVKNAWVNVLTFGWDRATFSIGDFFVNNGQSKYIRFNVNDMGYGENERASGKILIVSNNDEKGDNPFYNALVTFGGNDGENIIEEAYFGERKYRPEKITYEFITPAELEANVEKNGLISDTTYDFVILEDSIKETEISDKAYRALKTYSEKNNYLLYLKDWIVADDEDIVIDTDSNFHMLYKALVSPSGAVMQSNALLIPHGFFNKLNVGQETEKEGAKEIADLINSSNYRDHGGLNGSDNRMYRVLEIEPCYPIDLALAESQGSGYSQTGINNAYKGQYYLNGDSLISASADEVNAGTERYAFELSRAKIAHLTGLNANQIAIDYMSTNQLISSKEYISHYYDLVYIGGDYSALTETLKAAVNENRAVDPSVWDKITGYDMFTHTGLLRKLSSPQPRTGPFRDSIGGKDAVAGTIVKDDTYAELNGNDITTVKRQQLVDYVDAGLPIIIDGAVTDAFIGCYKYDPEPVDGAQKVDGASPSRLNQLKQHMIDPDSNMYSFLKYAYGKKDLSANISWGAVYTKAADATQKVENDSNKYGNTVTATATVYSDENEKKLRDVIDASAVRPRIVLTQKPKEYVDPEGKGSNPAVINIGPTVSFEASLLRMDGGSDDYTIKLLMDENGDGVFEEDAELKDSELYTATSTKVTLSFDLDKDFIGPVHWKIIARNEKKLCDMISGISYFKPEGDAKKEIRVLQLIPVPEDNQDMYNGTAAGGGKNDGTEDQTDMHSLYFCTECQMASKLINYNVIAGIDGTEGDMITALNHSSRAARINKEKVLSNKVNIGLHEHKFGIVKYGSDTAIGEIDDWDNNLVFDLTHGQDKTLETGEYSFDLDIMTSDQFDEMWDEASGRSDTDAAANKQTAKNELKKATNMLKDCDEEGNTLVLDEHKISVLEAKLQKELFAAVQLPAIKNSKFGTFISQNIGNESSPGQWVKDKEYYKLWTYYHTDSGKKNPEGAGYQASLDPLIEAYNNYVAVNNQIIEHKRSAKENNRKAATLTNDWLTENYDIVVLGFGEDFGGQNLSQLSSEMLKEYVEQGIGSVLETHDTMSRYKEAGSLNLTQTLRSTFGQDRFHAIDNSNDTTVSLSVPSDKVTFNLTKGYSNDIRYTDYKEEVTVDAQDCDINLNRIDQNTYKVGDVTYKTGDNEKAGYVTITFHGMNNYETIGYNIPGSDTITTSAQAQNNSVKIQIPIGSLATAKFNAPAGNSTGTFDAEAGTVALTDGGTPNSDGSIDVTLDTSYNGAPLADGTVVTMIYKGSSKKVAVSGGQISFKLIEPKTKTNAGLFNAPSDGSVYRKFATEDESKYFWTCRAIYDRDKETLADWEANNKGLLHYNSPIGATDFFIALDSFSRFDSPFRYAYLLCMNDLISGQPNASESYDVKYGTRRASQVNAGCVTMFPFSIDSELNISATHAQFYALDMEDETVSVWYTLGGTNVDGSLPNGGSALDLFKGSSYYAASPKDGMNNYFLYSKENVYYCGAGHANVTGGYRRNNHERKLFINIIVNAVTKGKSKMKLNLYNKCDNDKENCEDFLVDKDVKKNAKLAKEENVLFYSDTIGMYQYNMSQDSKYPEFDFKAISGTEPIEKMYVYYDLNYGKPDATAGTNFDDEYEDSTVKTGDHKLIVSYDKSDNKSEQRCRIRKDGDLEPVADLKDMITDNLELTDDYFKNYGNYTYMVIDVVNKAGEHATARIKINLIPTLFDLTDATFTNDVQYDMTFKYIVDMSDKVKYNI